MPDQAAKHFHPNHGPDDPAFKALLHHPNIAWPTLGWFCLTLMIWSTSTIAGLQQWWPVWCSVLLNGFMVFAFFTAVHDSSHHAIAKNSVLNDLIGTVAAWFWGPTTIFTIKTVRYIHMQHHLYTNEPNKDPDLWCAGKNIFNLFFRWSTIDMHYVYFYLKHIHKRPLREKLGLVLNTLLMFSVWFLLIEKGYGWQTLWYWIIPGRIGLFLLSFALDYLPHTPHQTLQADDAYQATNIRVGNDWLLTPLLMYHNYHLTHHLFPLVPFYRYRKLWLQGEAYFLEKQPSIVSPLGRKLTVEEYKQLYPKRSIFRYL